MRSRSFRHSGYVLTAQRFGALVDKGRMNGLAQGRSRFRPLFQRGRELVAPLGASAAAMIDASAKRAAGAPKS